MAVMERGRDRYNIYCAPVMRRTGLARAGGLRSADANGQMAIKPPTFHSKRLGQMPVGQIYTPSLTGRRVVPCLDTGTS